MSATMVNPNLKACPDCGREVSIRAAACPHCGAPSTAPQSVEQFIHATSKKENSSTGEKLFLFAVLSVCGLVGLLVMFAKFSKSDGKETPRSAWFMATQFVEKRLAPKPAKFPNPDEPVNSMMENADGSFDLAGYVDTVNDFNGPVRKYWSAKLRKNPDDDTWTCLSMELR